MMVDSFHCSLFAYFAFFCFRFVRKSYGEVQKLGMHLKLAWWFILLAVMRQCDLTNLETGIEGHFLIQ